MNESIFEDTFFGNGSIAGTPADEDVEELIDIPEADDESSSEGDTPSGNILELLSRMRGLMPNSDGDEDMDDNDMDSDDYHNKAVDRARRGRNREATDICMEGLKKFPLNVDLLADTIKYSSEAGDMQTAADHYSILKANVPFQRWNWRAFTFSFDYLLKEDPIANEDECRSIVEHYKKYLPYEEKASMAESELEAALGNAAGSMSVLKEAISTHANASQCALRLADMQMNRGLFVDVLETTNYGIAASAEAQPSINIPYLYYIRALAKDHLLHKKVCSGEPVTKDELEALKEEYDLLLSEFPELMRHAHMIKMRVKMLKFVKAEQTVLHSTLFLADCKCDTTTRYEFEISREVKGGVFKGRRFDECFDHSDFYGTTTLSIDKMPDAPFYLDQEHKTLFVIAGSRNVYCGKLPENGGTLFLRRYFLGVDAKDIRGCHFEKAETTPETFRFLHMNGGIVPPEFRQRWGHGRGWIIGLNTSFLSFYPSI